MAALIERNGWFYAQFHSEDRKPRYKRVALGVKRKRQARQLLSRLVFGYQSGQYDPWTDDPRTFEPPRQAPDQEEKEKTIREALDLFIESKVRADRSEETIRTYRMVIGVLASEVGVTLPLSRLSPRHLEAYIRKPSLSKATCHLRYRHVKAFLNWCVKQDLLERSPLRDVDPPDLPDKLPKAMTEEDLDAICEVIRKDYESKRRRRLCREGEMIWMIPMFRFAYYTGMRSSELLRLRWSDLDLDKRLIYIRKQKNKKEQTIPLNRKAHGVLQEVRPATLHDYVFRAPGSTGDEPTLWLRNSLSRKFTRYRHKAGIERKISLHSARHGFCTRLAEAGKPGYVIQALARHSDIKTSMRYVHLSAEHLKQEVDDVFG